MDRTQELEEQVRQLSQTVDDMRGRMARLEDGAPADGDGTPRRSRRGFLRMGAAAAAGALGWVAVKAVPAAAATGGYMVLGSANSAANPTTVQASAAISPAFAAEDQNFSQSNLTTALGTFTEAFSAPLQGLGGAGGVGGTEGLDAWASGGTAYGVYGFTDTGTGVTGESLSGIGLYARTSGRIRQDPLTAAGDPTPLFPSGPDLMEQVRDADGVLWIHNAAGVWRRVNSVRTDATNGSGVFKPFRRVDTRLLGGLKAAGGLYPFTVAGQGSGASAIPADAIAVVGNLAAVNYTGPGFLTIMPAGITLGIGAGQYNKDADPSSVNFIVGQAAIANAFVCGLDSSGSLQVYVGVHSSHFVIDITAYIQ